MSYAPLHTAQHATNRPSSCRNSHGWALTADRPSKHARHENEHCMVHTLSMTWRDLAVNRRARLYSLQNALKLLTHLRSSSKSLAACFATWNPAKWHENQIEIRSKTFLIPQTLRIRVMRNWHPPRCQLRKSSFVHSADLCRGGVRVRVKVRGRVRAVIDIYDM